MIIPSTGRSRGSARQLVVADSLNTSRRASVHRLEYQVDAQFHRFGASLFLIGVSQLRVLSPWAGGTLIAQ
jgi:hypothetical protein